MKRRAFLALLASAAVGLAVDPDLAAWKPKQKTFILPPAAGWKAIHDAQWEYNRLQSQAMDGISMRIVRQFDGVAQVHRLDVLYGWSTLRPKLACRVVSA